MDKMRWHFKVLASCKSASYQKQFVASAAAKTDAFSWHENRLVCRYVLGQSIYTAAVILHVCSSHNILHKPYRVLPCGNRRHETFLTLLPRFHNDFPRRLVLVVDLGEIPTGA